MRGQRLGLRLLQAGTTGYLLKRSTADGFEGHRDVMAGDAQMGAALRAVVRFAQHQPASGSVALSARELVLDALSRAAVEVADSLGISMNTVRTHIKNLQKAARQLARRSSSAHYHNPVPLSLRLRRRLGLTIPAGEDGGRDLRKWAERGEGEDAAGPGDLGVMDSLMWRTGMHREHSDEQHWQPDAMAAPASHTGTTTTSSAV